MLAGCCDVSRALFSSHARAHFCRASRNHGDARHSGNTIAIDAIENSYAIPSWRAANFRGDQRRCRVATQRILRGEWRRTNGRVGSHAEVRIGRANARSAAQLPGQGRASRRAKRITRTPAVARTCATKTERSSRAGDSLSQSRRMMSGGSRAAEVFSSTASRAVATGRCLKGMARQIRGATPRLSSCTHSALPTPLFA